MISEWQRIKERDDNEKNGKILSINDLIKEKREYEK